MPRLPLRVDKTSEKRIGLTEMSSNAKKARVSSVQMEVMTSPNLDLIDINNGLKNVLVSCNNDPQASTSTMDEPQASTSSGKKHVVHFDDLSEDILFHVVHFLTLEEKFAYERISSRLGRAINGSLVYQKHLVSAFLVHRDMFQNKCQHNHHRFNAKFDTISDIKGLSEHTSRVTWSVIKRCPNLITLRLMSNSFTTFFGQELAEICPKIQHFEFRDVNSFVGASDYLETEEMAQENGITCILIGQEDHEADDNNDDFESYFLPFLQKSKKLETFVNLSTFNTEDVMKIVVPRVKDLRIGMFEEPLETLRMVINKGCNIEKLSIKDEITDNDTLCDLKKIPKLTSLEVCFDLEKMDQFIGAFGHKNLTEFKFNPGPSSYLCEETKDFLTECGSHLKVLHLLAWDAPFRYLDEWPALLPHLQELGFFCRYEYSSIDDISRNFFNRFPRIKKLYLRNATISNQNFRAMINGFNGMKELYLIRMKFTQHMKQTLLTYADEHQGDKIHVYVDYQLAKEAFDLKETVWTSWFIKINIPLNDYTERLRPNLTIHYTN